MRRKIKRINGRDILASLVKIVIASAAMSAAAYGAYYFLTRQFVTKPLLIRIVEAIAPIMVGGIMFIVAAKLLRIGELEAVYNGVRKKLQR